MRYFIIGFLSLCLLYMGFSAISIASPLTDKKYGYVQGIVNQDILVLKNSDDKVRLSGIYIPNFTQKKAHKKLNDVLLNQDISLDISIKNYDRYGYLLAQVKRKSDELWIQSVLLEEGIAYVRPNIKDNDKVINDLYVIEAKARNIGAGLWSKDKYKVKSPDNIDDYYNSWQVVQGEIVSVAVKKKYTYLNFGEDWRTDFTIQIQSKYIKKFEESMGLELRSLTGRKIRIRGWIEKYNGAMVTPRYPSVIELI